MLYHLVYRESIAWVNVPRMRRFLKGRTYDLAYIFGLHDVGLGCAFVPQEFGIPILWHFGDHFLADQKSRYTYSPLFNLMGHTILRSVRKREQRVRVRNAAFLSVALEKYFAGRGVIPDHSYLIPRGIEFPIYDGEPRILESPPVFLLACRLSKDKGVHVAIEAGKILDARGPDRPWQLQIAGAGDPSYENQLHAMAESIPDRVRFLGRLTREETVQHMRGATASINASVWPEPFGNSIIESLASGAPLIASETESIVEIIEPGRSALTYPRESATALADRMQEILESEALRDSLSREGAAVVRERYTATKILDRTVEVMNEVVARGSKV
jgi:glycosyltransferase involved in cell wall biosynthesis